MALASTTFNHILPTYPNLLRPGRDRHKILQHQIQTGKYTQDDRGGEDDAEAERDFMFFNVPILFRALRLLRAGTPCNSTQIDNVRVRHYDVAKCIISMLGVTG
jgi:hypothetical protein